MLKYADLEEEEKCRCQNNKMFKRIVYFRYVHIYVTKSDSDIWFLPFKKKINVISK